MSLHETECIHNRLEELPSRSNLAEHQRRLMQWPPLLIPIQIVEICHMSAGRVVISNEPLILTMTCKRWNGVLVHLLWLDTVSMSFSLVGPTSSRQRWHSPTPPHSQAHFRRRPPPRPPPTRSALDSHAHHHAESPASSRGRFEHERSLMLGHDDARAQRTATFVPNYQPRGIAANQKAHRHHHHHQLSDVLELEYPQSSGRLDRNDQHKTPYARKQDVSNDDKASPTPDRQSSAYHSSSGSNSGSRNEYTQNQKTGRKLSVSIDEDADEIKRREERKRRFAADSVGSGLAAGIVTFKARTSASSPVNASEQQTTSRETPERTQWHPLPKPWVWKKSTTGHWYCLNTASLESRWSPPHVADNATEEHERMGHNPIHDGEKAQPPSQHHIEDVYDPELFQNDSDMQHRGRANETVAQQSTILPSPGAPMCRNSVESKQTRRTVTFNARIHQEDEPYPQKRNRITQPLLSLSRSRPRWRSFK